MNSLLFLSENEFIYHWCGKFDAPGPDYVHLTRDLLDFEFFLVTEGTLKIADSLHEYTVNAGEYLIMSPDRYQHGFAPSRANFYWMHFGYNHEANDFILLPEPTTYAPGSIQMPRSAKLRSLERIIPLLTQLIAADRRYGDITLNRYLCSAVLAEVAVQTEPFKSTKDLCERQLISKIKEYIGWHMDNSLKITEIADYFGYNAKYLTTLFKNTTGTSLKKYLLTVTMNEAGRLLSDTDRTVADIAEALGFCDAHNFSNAFKKVMGTSPSEYRQFYNR